MAIEFRLLLWFLGALGLVLAGVWVQDARQAKRERDLLRDQNVQLVVRQAVMDHLLTDRLQAEARIDRAVADSHNQRQEAKRRDPAYREYLDRPLPEQSLRLYRDAAARLAAARAAGADRAGTAAEQDPERAAD